MVLSCKSIGWLAGIFSMALLTAFPAGARELTSSGYVPVDAAEFASFPKVSRYRGFLPEAVDLSSRFPTPRDQGSLNSCTGWAVGYAARSYYAHSVEGRKRDVPRDIPSPSFIYHAIRDPKKCDSGSTLTDALKLLQTGSLSLADYPYRDSCDRPDKSQSEAATDFKIDQWLAVRPAVH